MRTKVGDPKGWVAIVIGAVAAAAVLTMMGVVLDAKGARAATPTRATIEATQFTVENGQTGEAFAVCPTGKRVVGGGVVQSGPAERRMVVRASGPLDGTGVTLNTGDGDVARQWYAAVFNGTGAERTFKVFAICSRSSKATIEATQFRVQSGQSGEAFAVCPTGKRALGGGAVQSGPVDAFNVSANGPLDASGVTVQTVTGDVAKQWYAAMVNFTSAERTFRVFAICSGDSSAKIKATPFPVQAGQTNEAFAVCGVGKRALGGGVVQSGPATGLFVRASGPLDGTGVTLETRDGDVARQWYAATAIDGGLASRDFKVFAICE